MKRTPFAAMMSQSSNGTFPFVLLTPDDHIAHVITPSLLQHYKSGVMIILGYVTPSGKVVIQGADQNIEQLPQRVNLWETAPDFERFESALATLHLILETDERGTGR